MGQLSNYDIWFRRSQSHTRARYMYTSVGSTKQLCWFLHPSPCYALCLGCGSCNTREQWASARHGWHPLTPSQVQGHTCRMAQCLVLPSYSVIPLTLLTRYKWLQQHLRCTILIRLTKHTYTLHKATYIILNGRIALRLHTLTYQLILELANVL